jgi:hypothetical protein
MKILKQSLVAAMMFAACFTGAMAQNADDIIQKHIDAVGGTDNWNKIKTVKMKGIMSMGGMEINITQTVANDKGMKMEIDANGMKGYNIITPSEGWIFMPGMEKVTKIPDDQLKSSQDKINIKTGQLVDKSKIGKAEYIGTDSVNSMNCYKLKITDKDGNVQTAFFDAVTYYLVRSEMKVKVQDDEKEMAVNYSNFKKQPEGIVFPMTIGTEQGDVNFKSVELNKPVDDNFFKPADSDPK